MKKAILSIMILLGLVIYSCKDDDKESMSTYSIRMTDAPGDYEAVYINIKEVEVKTTKGDYVFAVNERINLLDFVNGRDTVIFTQDILTAKVTQIRLVLHEDGNDVVIDGVTYPLETPSAMQSGLKIIVDHTLVAGYKYEVLLDFDASKSIVETGTGTYILKPVIKAVSYILTEGIKGVIVPATAGAAVIAVSGTDTFASYSDQTTGEFTISTSHEGVYNLMIDANDQYYDTTILNITVNDGAYTSIGNINLRPKL